MRNLLSLGLSLSLGALAGCSLAPDYERPAAPVPGTFPSGGAYGDVRPGAGTVDALGWQDVFLDPALKRLIDIALRNNRDLRVAALNVQSAEAQFRAQRGEIFPQIGATGSADYAQTPADLGAGARTGRTSPTTSSTFGIQGGFTSWEIDLFGRIRSLSEAALETAFAQAETQRATQISLVASVADAYLTVLANRQLLELTKQTLASQEQSYRLTQATVAGGTSTALVLRQAQTQVEQARANLSLYTRQLAQAENALALLLGQPVPADLPQEVNLASPLIVGDLPAGLSSEVLLRRPDVLSAERLLRAANANIGAARAAFFPSITLTASYGTAGASLARLFQPGSGIWAFSPQINVPIFTGGINEANLDFAKIQSRIEVANYEKAIQTAFREVADSLAARGTYGDQLRAQQALTDAYAASYQLSEARFRAGVDNYLTVLVSQRDLYAAQQLLIGLQRDRLSAQVTLYRVLGGGWLASSATPPPEPVPPSGAPQPQVPRPRRGGS
ncbi:efflux transporter outer membrane subunit [Roseomonas indoligenes]|uniref:Efflux transporter outer membrane subunit n=1 Tax=Roseomonas indoligenes TaxID=2820811 RepID=A0A940MU96_9PROT|nr:efflux transporter outer membrane subunit [Pararoseomonas indoligenes]MBP0494238.1 efflux transporter outer membrane subunit [Pararoseomonas indoligenes]